MHRLRHLASLMLSAYLLLANPARAADPTSSPPILIDPLDPRAGEGASLVGAPLLALLVVLGVGILAAAAAVAYVKLASRR